MMHIQLRDPPRFQTNKVKSFLKEMFNIVPKVKPLVSDIGQNFHVIDQKGKEYILKISNMSESKWMLEAQNAVLDHLKTKNIDFRFPQIIPNLNNENISRIVSNEEKTYHVRLFSYLPGKFLADVSPHSQDLLSDLGLLLGSLDKYLLEIDHPAINRYWHWDLMNLPDLKH